MLSCTDLEVSFGRIDVLRGASLSAGKHEMVAIIGPNGSGKTTFLRALAGLARTRAGTIEYGGVDITHKNVRDRFRLGVTLVPQGRRLFGGLTVKENLRLGAYGCKADAERVRSDLDRWMSLFPILREAEDAKAAELSGGQQQMVAIVRGLMSRPSLLLLDEPSIGLAPVMVTEVEHCLQQVRDHEQLTIVLVEQNLGVVRRIAERVAVFKQGRTHSELAPADLDNVSSLAEVYFS